MNIKHNPASVSHLTSGDWRYRTLLLLTRAGIKAPEEIIEKTKALEEYFFKGNFNDFEAKSSEDLLLLNFKMKMVHFYLSENTANIDDIVKTIDKLKPYFLDHIIESVKDKPLSEIMSDRYGANFY